MFPFARETLKIREYEKKTQKIEKTENAKLCAYNNEMEKIYEK